MHNLEKIKNKEIKIECYILLIGFFLAILPLIGEGLFIGDDYVYHLSRIDSLKENFVNGDFITKIHGKLANTYGYGTGFFYCDLFIIVPAFLCYLGVPLEWSVKILYACISLALLMVSYFAVNLFLKNKQISAVIAVLAANSHYVLMNMYGRTALGELLGFVFLILVVAGLYNMIEQKFSRPYILIGGFCGVILSHTITTMFAFAGAVIVSCIYIKRLYKEKLFLKIIVSAVITLLLTAWYWMPMVEQMLVQKYKYSIPWIHTYNNVQNPITSLGGGKIELGIFLTIIFLVGIFLAYKYSELRRWLITAMILLLVIGFKPFWQKTHIITGFIQFPWRLLGVIAITQFIILGLLLKKIPKSVPVIAIAAILITFNYVCNISFFDNDTTHMDIQTVHLYNVQGELGGGKEWMPLAQDTYNRTTPQQAICDNGVRLNGKKEGLTFEFVYPTSMDNGVNTVEIPYIFYKGYKAYYKNQSGEGSLLITKSENDLVLVNMPPDINQYGDTYITVKYEYTTWAKISIFVSVVTLGLCGMGVYWKKKKYKESR